MARRVQLQIAKGDGPGTPAGVDWPGGRGLLMVDATFGGGNVALQQLSPNNVWLPLNAEATVTPISVTANGTVNFSAPAGQIRASITTATGVTAHIIGIPTNNAG